MYSGPVKIIIDGDATLLGGHVVYARTKARQLMDRLDASGGAHLTQKYQLPDNVLVTARASKMQDERILQVIISQGCAIHMDSGIADMIALGQKNPDRYDNAILLVGSRLSGNTFWGRVSPYSGKGRTAIPVGSLTAPRAASPANVTGQEIECLQYVEPVKPKEVDANDWETQVQLAKNGLLGKKTLVAYTFSSYFSGKMRLYIQSVHARKLDDSTKPAPSLSMLNSNPPQLQMPMYDAKGDQYTIKAPNGNDIPQFVRIENNSTLSTGIYTDSDGEYWYITIIYMTQVTVKVTKMRLTSCGQVAVDHIQKNKNLTRFEKAKYEALALSHGTPEGEVSFEFVNTVKFPIVGASLAYGWTFKWDGSEARIIVHDRTSGFIAYHLRITISRSGEKFAGAEGGDKLALEKSRWSITGSVVEGGNAWISKTGIQNVWVPNFAEGGVREVVAAEYGTVCFGDAPLYCFYDTSDELQVLRYTGKTQPEHIDTQFPPCYTGGGIWTNAATGNQTGEKKTYQDDVIGSFTCGGVSVQGRVAYCSRDYSSTTTSAAQAQTNYSFAAKQNQNSPSPCAARLIDVYNAQKIAAASPEGLFSGWVARYNTGVNVNVIEFGVESEVRYIAAVIPWGDCAAVYLSETGYKVQSGVQTVNTNPGWIISEEGRATKNIAGNPFIYAGPYLYNNADQQSYGGAPATTSVVEPFNRNFELPNRYLFVGYGANQSTEKGDWNQNLMSPPLRNLSDQHTFSTFSSANYGDTIGMGFETGGYPVDNRGPSLGLMFNRAFIGFA